MQFRTEEQLIFLGPSKEVLHFLHELLVGVVLGKLGLSLLHLG
jgi:hypothetical protein